jgi:spermidine synthase
VSGSLDFEELDYRETPMGELTLRRRAEPRLDDRVVYEVKLGDEFLMSSLFTDSEVALATQTLAQLRGTELDVAVGGLGLGYTAVAALAQPGLRSLLVIDAMQAVIDWHRAGLVPNGELLCGDPRCRLQQGDFFALLRSEPPDLDPAQPGRRFHAVLVDIDHSPSHRLHPSSADFYTAAGLARLASLLHPGGIFGLWSNDPPDGAFGAVLAEVFARWDALEVRFPNPYTGNSSACTVYRAFAAAPGGAQAPP